MDNETTELNLNAAVGGLVDPVVSCDLPCFAVLEYNPEGEYWTCNLTRKTYDEALAEKNRLEGKCVDNLYLAGLTFIVGPHRS